MIFFDAFHLLLQTGVQMQDLSIFSLKFEKVVLSHGAHSFYPPGLLFGLA